MNEDTAPQGGVTNGNSVPIAENQYVKELFSILSENSRDTSGLSALLGHVKDMEDFVKRAESKIVDMKSQLDSMKEVQNHPIKASLQNAIRSLESKVADVKEQLAALKDSIIESCKTAVTAFKEKGIAALNNIASFFHIKSNLQSMSNDMTKSVGVCDKAITQIDTFSKEYHSAGRHLKNMARVAIGKEPVDAKKEAGKLAKALQVPYRAQKSVLTGMRNTIDKAITKLGQLENSQAVKQAQREIAKKPSLMERLEANKERVAQKKLELPVPERAPVAKGMEV